MVIEFDLKHDGQPHNENSLVFRIRRRSIFVHALLIPRYVALISLHTEPYAVGLKQLNIFII